jgi:hypothetical protein
VPCDQRLSPIIPYTISSGAIHGVVNACAAAKRTAVDTTTRPATASAARGTCRPRGVSGVTVSEPGTAGSSRSWLSKV